MAQGLFLSVVIPSYNETENLRSGVLEAVSTYLRTQKYSWEVIISDDGSPSQEARTLAKDFCQSHPGFVFLENEHGGKPFALWSGIQKAQGQIVLITDMDQSTPIYEIEKLLPYYDQGYDLVIGSRGVERKNFSLFRQLASTVFRAVRRAVLLRKIIDTQAGFKSFKKEIAMAIFPQMQVIRLGRPKQGGWKVGAWDVEMLFVAEKHGYKIAEVPISWANRDLAMDTKQSSSGGKFVKESLEMLQEIFRVRLNDLRGYYNKTVQQ